MRGLPAISLLLLAFPAASQVSPSLYDYARPELDWYTIETEHFNVIFHLGPDGEGSSRSARVVARIAEEIYGPVTRFWGHEPTSRVSIIIKDFEDYSNGAAYFFDNKIEIWAPALDSPLRGDHDWLRNVITHEFTHIVQIQVAMKAGRSFPFAYLQILDYESVRRPDVLYGYPNVIVSYPLASLNNPAWLAEGTAQYQRSWLDYDRWDSHRDMFLRMRILSGSEMGLAEMGSFYSKSGLLREGVYNHGYAFTRYLATTYGEDALARLSRALARWTTFTVERALEEALGVDADTVYVDWVTTLRREYSDRTEALRGHTVEGEVLESDGYANYHPVFSPDGHRLAWVSNRGRHSSRTSLYVRDLTDGNVAIYDVGEEELSSASTYTCSLGHRLRSGVAGGVTWRPDGKAIVYVRRRTTPEGFLHDDLYEIDLNTKAERRLTRSQRASFPAYALDGSRIAFVGQKDGTTNVYTLDPVSREVTALTHFTDGSQVSEPVWHPSADWVYFARLSRMGHGRDIWRVKSDGADLESVVESDADERSPAIGGPDDTLYYSSDETGIYNVYRRLGDVSEVLTNVIGGAFMPDVRADGGVVYALFGWDGYKIAMLKHPVSTSAPRYEAPPILRDKYPQSEADVDEAIIAYNDRDIRAFDVQSAARLREEENVTLAPDSQAVSKYALLTTGFSFYPVARLDRYVSRRRSVLEGRLLRRTRVGTFVRNLKIGSYVSSREILEGIRLFGGMLVSPGSQKATSVGDFFSPSRLITLERDAFLLFDYNKGLPIFPKRWSPQFSLELFNIRRVVENGLAIEEFPCTACLPDTTLADLNYSLWEADIYARSKVNDYVLLELGYRFSPYRVITERFFSKEAQLSIPESSSRYFIGRTVLAKAYVELRFRHRDDDVLPTGLRLDVGYEFHIGRLLDRFALENGVLVPIYGKERMHRLTLDARWGWRMPGLVRGHAQGLLWRLRISTILGQEVDDFYDDYVGGLIGARGYPFYALGGNETLWLQGAWVFPLFTDIGRQFLFTYLDKTYLRLYADAASVSRGSWPGALRKDAGAELRVKLGSYYLLPTAVFLSATYGFDSFNFQLDEGFVTPSGDTTVRYGSELRWHFGVLFGFDL